MKLNWIEPAELAPLSYKCGHCETTVAGNSGLSAKPTDVGQGLIYLCPNCRKPSFFFVTFDQLFQEMNVRFQEPSPSYGQDVLYLPIDVRKIYAEARRCFKVDAFSATVMLSRKLLMHIAVDRGAKAGDNFVSYVNFLVDKGLVAPTHRAWVDSIRVIGNEANHELSERTRDAAKSLIEFSEMLLRTVYEYPARTLKTGSLPA